jgi:hypothetical protein
MTWICIMAINRDKPTTKPATPKAEIPASPPVTFNLEDVNKIVNEALAKQSAAFAVAMADMKGQAKPAANGHSTKSAENEWKTIKAFKKLGVTAKPRVDTFTFNIWVSKGFRPVEGSKAVKVANLRLFHKSQVRPLTKEELAGLQAKADEAVNANKAKIDAAVGLPRKGKVIPLNGGEASPQ